MARLALNKSSLKHERDQLAMFERFLPSLDLKRQQLLVEQKRAASELAAIEQKMERFLASQEGLLKLLGASELDLSGLVQIAGRELDEENVVGVRLPALRQVRFHTPEYSTLAKPFWVDILVQAVRELAALRIGEQVQRRRIERLAAAVRRVTQRVNLFEKVLIPNARKNIQQIQIHLADAERAGVVRSKLAKAKQKSWPSSL